MTSTIGTLKKALSDRLATITASPEQTAAEVRLIFQCLLGLDSAFVLLHPEHQVSHHQQEQLDALMNRRIQQRIPLQYLLGEACFYGLRLHVSSGVLIPRPETELLVERAIALCRERGYRTVLDIGTGSGAIALAVAKTLGSRIQVTATDLSPAALGVAKHNAQTLDLPVQFRYGNLFEPVAGSTFDLILSNPPYIDLSERETLTLEVRVHEPAEALFAPEGRYSFYERIAEESSNHLTPGGAVAVEMGFGMADQIAAIFQAQGFSILERIPDYAGIDRHLVARKEP